MNGFSDTASATVVNTTFSGNYGGEEGGAIRNDGTIALTNTTISNNRGSDAFHNFETAIIANSIIAGDVAGDVSGETFTSLGYNLIGGGERVGDFNAPGDLVNTDPGLAPLADSDGPTQTHALLNGSLAIDAGNNDLAVDADGAPLAFDQRGDGFDRIVNGTVDIGAFEAQVGEIIEPEPPVTIIPVTIIVDTTIDENDGSIEDGDVSLRDAILAANSGDTITFASGAGEAFEGGSTIRLDQALGELVLSSDVTIDGDLNDDGAPDVTITGDTLGDDATTTDPYGNTITDPFVNTATDDNVRVFAVDSGNSTIQGLIITGGFAEGSGSAQYGGGIAIEPGADLTVVNSSISGNYAEQGGGFFNTGALSVIDSTLAENLASGGGGIINDGTATVAGSTFSGNYAENGGGLWNDDGTATLTNTTFSGNAAQEEGSAIRNDGSITLSNTTISNNEGGFEGLGAFDNKGTAVIANTIIAGNEDGEDVSGDLFTSLGYNLIGGGESIGDFNAQGDRVNADPGLAPFADNGGPTQTHALLDDSPAIDAGNNSFAVDADGTPLAFDQRGDGFDRIVNGTVDIGAFEAQDADATVTIIVDTTVDENDGSIEDGDVSLRDAILAANSGDTITFASGAGEAFEGGGTIRLDQGLGQLVLTEDVTIDGDLNDDVAPDITLDANADGDGDATTALGQDGPDFQARRVMDIAESRTVTLDGLIVTGGATTADFWAGGGGGIRAGEDSDLTLTNSTVSGNSTAGDEANGGGISGGTVTLTNSTVSGNGTVGRGADGGGISGRDVTLTNSTVSGNSISGGPFTIYESDEVAGYYPARGGGISGGDVTLTNSTVSGNSTAGALADGGGINGGSVTLTNSTVSDNGTVGKGASGGGISGGDVTLTNSTVSGNSTTGLIWEDEESGEYFPADGGGINGGSVTLTNSTVSDNGTVGKGASGGGISGGDVTLTNSTVSGNSTTGLIFEAEETGEYFPARGGGISGGDVTLTNSIVLGNVALNAGDDEVSAGSVSNTASLIGGDATQIFADTADVLADSDEDGVGDPPTGVQGGVLADNGGPTETIALLDDASNPALDTADPALASATDQRGVARPQGAGPDIGAFELERGPVTIIEGTPEDDRLVGSPDDEWFFGLAGNDTLIGCTGQDSFDGGDGSDTVDYRYSTSNTLKIDLEDEQAIFESTGVTETLTSIENAIGSRGRTKLYGDDGNNVLDGDDGDDCLSGRGGDDTLLGGDGDDTLIGGKGEDSFDGGDGSDTADYSYSRSDTLVIDLAADQAVFHSSGVTETLTSIENAVGSYGDTVLKGDDGDNVLDGHDGDDTLVGGGGDDTLIGGEGEDVLVFTPGDGFVTVTDFTPGEDAVDLTAFGFEDIDALAELVREDGDDVVVDLTSVGGPEVTFLDVDLSEASPDDVLL